jgi:hypothetical protein
MMTPGELAAEAALIARSDDEYPPLRLSRDDDEAPLLRMARPPTVAQAPILAVAGILADGLLARVAAHALYGRPLAPAFPPELRAAAVNAAHEMADAMKRGPGNRHTRRAEKAKGRRS